MHELGVVFEVVKTVESFVKKYNLTKVDKVVLQIGELSSMIPKYIRACYPAAVDGTILENTKLEIEVLPGNCLCKNCNKIYNLLQNRDGCPNCKENDWELLGGKEFMVKEIVAC